MPAPKGQGIADDAAEYEELNTSPRPRAPSIPPPLKKSGIAEDAESFAGLIDETTDKARTLESDWLYQLNGQVFGPVKPRELLDLLYGGQIDKDTPIAVSDGEFAALHRYGVFRVHLPKVEKRKIEIEGVRIADDALGKAKRKKLITYAVFAGLIAAPAIFGIVQYIRHLKQEAARREAHQKEEALLKEVDALMATVTIEPPLVDLVDEGDDKGDAPSKRRRRHGVARFSRAGGSEIIGAGGTGELSRQEIMMGIARSFGGIKRCIVEQMQRDPGWEPEQIVLTFSVNNEGRIADTSVGDRILRASPMRECFARTLGEVRYRSFKGEVQNVEYPITIGRQ